ncbi:MAG: universal stress protein [Acidimicrobiales bacterium]
MSLVLVAIDDTDASVRVGHFVNDFFDRSEVEVIGLNVGRGPAAWVPPMVGWGGAWSWSAYPYAYTVEEQTRAHDEQAAATEEAAARAVEESDLRSSETVVEHGGDPADVILTVADERGADLIVVGTSHKGLLQRLMDPSVSDQVLKHADRPVIVVP